MLGRVSPLLLIGHWHVERWDCLALVLINLSCAELQGTDGYMIYMCVSHLGVRVCERGRVIFVYVCVGGCVKSYLLVCVCVSESVCIFVWGRVLLVCVCENVSNLCVCVCV